MLQRGGARVDELAGADGGVVGPLHGGVDETQVRGERRMEVPVANLVSSYATHNCTEPGKIDCRHDRFRRLAFITRILGGCSEPKRVLYPRNKEVNMIEYLLKDRGASHG